MSSSAFQCRQVRVLATAPEEARRIQPDSTVHLAFKILAAGTPQGAAEGDLQRLVVAMGAGMLAPEVGILIAETNSPWKGHCLAGENHAEENQS